MQDVTAFKEKKKRTYSPPPGQPQKPPGKRKVERGQKKGVHKKKDIYKIAQRS